MNENKQTKHTFAAMEVRASDREELMAHRELGTRTNIFVIVCLVDEEVENEKWNQANGNVGATAFSNEISSGLPAISFRFDSFRFVL